MTKEALERILQGLRDNYKKMPEYKQVWINLANHAKWEYERENDTTGIIDKLI